MQLRWQLPVLPVLQVSMMLTRRHRSVRPLHVSHAQWVSTLQLGRFPAPTALLDMPTLTVMLGAHVSSARLDSTRLLQRRAAQTA